MSVNKHAPHVLVLPEDDANLQLAKEFHVNVPWDRQGQMRVLPVAGGRDKVMRLFQEVHTTEMRRWELR